MEDISLHILDIAQNSITANATLVEIAVTENSNADELRIEIKDNGKGIPSEILPNITNPFVTSRKTRKVGLGLSLFQAGAQQAGGDLKIDSTVGVGTTVIVWYQLSNIDRIPLGDVGETVLSLILCNPNIDFVYESVKDGHSFRLDTREIRDILGNDVALNDPDVFLWLKEYIAEGAQENN